MSHPKVHGIHDLIVHDYGPGRRMITLHLEVPGDEDVFQLLSLIHILNTRDHFIEHIKSGHLILNQRISLSVCL